MPLALKNSHQWHIIYEEIRKYFLNIEEISKIQTYKVKVQPIKIARKKKQNNKNTKTNAKHE